MYSHRAAQVVSLLVIAASVGCSTLGGAGRPREEDLMGYAVLRGDLDNARFRFLDEKRGRVVFLGGSITHMEGWRNMIASDLEKRFPETAFTFVDAGIPSTDTTMGAARLGQDVFGEGAPDLLFVEFAVNDSTNGRSAEEMIRGMEGVIRQARLHDPYLDIIMMYFADEDKMACYEAGKVPGVVASHERVAQHYDAPSINLAREVTERIRTGEFDWNAFGGLHPAPFGHGVYRDAINRLLDSAWREPLPDGYVPQVRRLPRRPLDRRNYAGSYFVPIEQARLDSGWQIEPSWKPTDNAQTREGFVDVPMLVAREPGATLRFAFSGCGVGLIITAGPDAGTITYSIDGGEEREVDPFTEWSHYLHIPWALTLEADLDARPHELVLRVSGNKNPNSQGHTVCIRDFVVNDGG